MSAKELDADADNVLDEEIVAAGTPAPGKHIGFDGSKSVWEQIYTFSPTAPVSTTTIWFQDLR
jgi:hypothetical protein